MDEYDVLKQLGSRSKADKDRAASGSPGKSSRKRSKDDSEKVAMSEENYLKYADETVRQVRTQNSPSALARHVSLTSRAPRHFSPASNPRAARKLNTLPLPSPPLPSPLLPSSLTHSLTYLLPGVCLGH